MNALPKLDSPRRGGWAARRHTNQSMKPNTLFLAVTLVSLLHLVGCATYESQRTEKYQQNLKAMSSWQLESHLREVNRRIDQLGSPATFVSGSPFSIGAASGELSGLRAQREQIWAEFEARGLLAPGKSYSGAEFFRRLNQGR